MNLLAHAYLSFETPGILEGNMISDYVKGKKQFEYSRLIQKGIKLHREIDTFTDNHLSTKRMKQFFSPAYRLYSGAFCDIVYDYFLANDTSIFRNKEDLKEFTGNTYETLGKQLPVLPDQFQRMFPYMTSQDWLYNYRFTWGIEKSFNGMASRAKFISETHTAFNIFLHALPEFQLLYDAFFPMLKKFTILTMEELLNND